MRHAHQQVWLGQRDGKDRKEERVSCLEEDVRRKEKL